MFKEKGDNCMDKNNYPAISDELINVLKRDFPNQLPQKEISLFELGRLLGQQNVVDKLIFEKEYNEKRLIEEEEKE